MEPSPTKLCPLCAETIQAAAVKCRYCGGMLDGSEEAKRTPSDALAIIALLVPVAAAALAWTWISDMRLIDNPMHTLDILVGVTVLATGGLIAIDVTQHGGAVGGNGPVAWFIGSLLLWFLVYPIYFSSRAGVGAKNMVVGAFAVVIIFVGVSGWLGYAIYDQTEAIRSQIAASQAEQAQAAEEEAEAQTKAAAETQKWAASYQQIHSGMSAKRVFNLLGQDNASIVSQTDIGGFNTVMINWKVPNGGTISVMFQNGRVASQSQFGLYGN